MAKLSKGFSLATAILGLVCLALGICISVISWVLASKAPTSIYHSVDGGSSGTYSYFTPYWWGGFIFLVPGILGIVAGYTRDVTVMVFFFVFDILCLLVSIGMVVMVISFIGFWQRVNNQLYSCKSSYEFLEECTCNYHGYIWRLEGATCEELINIQGLLATLASLGALTALMSSIASYVSCYSLYNQYNQRQDGSVRIQQQGFAVPPDNVAYTSNYQQATSPQYSPLCVHQGQPSYGAIPQYQNPVVDYGAQLVQSEVN